VRTFFGKGGRPHFLAQKPSNFSKFRMVRPQGHGGVHFSRFCADVFYGRTSYMVIDFYGLLLMSCHAH